MAALVLGYMSSCGVDIRCGSTGQLPVKGDVNLPASLEAKNYVEPGWEAAQAGLPTFTTSRPSTTPHRRPAGFKQCQPHELDRWKKDLHRYPPYQYRDENCLRSTKKDFRPPSVAEREAILGFVKGLCPGQFPTLQGLQLRPPVMEYHFPGFIPLAGGHARVLEGELRDTVAFCARQASSSQCSGRWLASPCAGATSSTSGEGPPLTSQEPKAKEKVESEQVKASRAALRK